MRPPEASFSCQLGNCEFQINVRFKSVVNEGAPGVAWCDEKNEAWGDCRTIVVTKSSLNFLSQLGTRPGASQTWCLLAYSVVPLAAPQPIAGKRGRFPLYRNSSLLSWGLLVCDLLGCEQNVWQSWSHVHGYQQNFQHDSFVALVFTYSDICYL